MADVHPPQYYYSPTCSGNGPNSAAGDQLCTAAVSSCPAADQIRVWVYVKTWLPEVQQYSAWQRRTAPPTVCLGPDELVNVDPLVAAVAAVRGAWRSFGLPGAELRTLPVGETLVGAETRFVSITPSQIQLPAKQVLGFSVVVSITATTYVWDFGDGHGLEVPAAGQPPVASHTYTSAGPKSVTLRTFYSGSFTVGGQPTVYPLPGLAEVPGLPAALLAREAASQLEAGTN